MTNTGNTGNTLTALTRLLATRRPHPPRSTSPAQWTTALR